MKRLIVGWDGPQIVGNAVSVLHFREVDNDIAAGVLTAYQALAPILPTGVTVTVPDNGEFIDEATGDLTGVWTEVGTGGSVPSTATETGAAAGVGACVTWLTGGIVNSHRVRGRTFVVPLRRSAYDATGTLDAPFLDILDDFAAAMVAIPVAVWSRPVAGGSPGSVWPATSYRLRDKVAYLSSRRD